MNCENLDSKVTKTEIEIEQQLKSICEELKKSPTFAMSLGAKELFHTNFLAFILENRSEELKQVQKNIREALLFEKKDNEESFCVVWREKKNFDLIVVPINKVTKEVLSNRFLVVEAKLKSIPTLKQLKEYDAVLVKGFDLDLPGGIIEEIERNKKVKIIKENASRVLLSPTNVNSADNDSWFYVNWDHVVKALENGQSICEKTLLPHLLKDYSQSLKNLLEIIRIVTPLVVEGKSWIYLKKLSSRSYFQNIRIHDFVGKYIACLFEQNIYKNIVKSIKPEKYCNWEFRSKSYYSTKGAPGIQFFLFKEDDQQLGIEVGVQIEGTQYRHFVACNPKNEKKLNDLQDSLGKWLFENPQCSKKNGKLYKYGIDAFRYTKSELDDSCSTICLSEKIVSSLKQLCTHLKSLEQTR